jgi:hypothetical protein
MSEETLEARPEASQTKAAHTRLDGVVIGVLAGFDDDGQPLVAFPGNTIQTGCPARASAALSRDDIGREVALLFEQGDPARPLIIGRIQRPEEMKRPAQPVAAEVDGERIEFNAKREIVLRCGKASITLTRAGKILIRGAYVLSRSSGANRIKGGSVQIN